MSQNQRQLKKIDKLLVANRGEIAIRIFRAASELKIRTVAIFTYEDRYSLHRYKADEAYKIGRNDDPLKPYLDIEEIILTAKRHQVDAIHPGYGFLSENVHFARRCQEEGLIFIGPDPEVMEKLGDKVKAKAVAIEARIPIIEGNKEVLKNGKIALKEAQRIGYPVILKAAAGGGGRGMRVVRNDEQLKKSFDEARIEAKKAFGDDTIFIEKYIDDPKHIEVQIMADDYGNMVHLFERDCSVQRRFQKVVEIAPSLILPKETKQRVYDYALAICKQVGFNKVGTVEFLVDKDNEAYFIEVNPRIQVEHTITEEVTGIDIVRSQILIAKGHRLPDPEIFIRWQGDIKCLGYAIQCRITTEDPTNGFKPDYGTLTAYRNAAGFGIRLDAGSAYNGMIISPFFDSLLVKVSAWGRTLAGAAARLHRALEEFRIRGVKTNIGFLMNVVTHEEFLSGRTTISFIDRNPDLLVMPRRQNRATRTLKYLADVIVNGNPDVKYFDPQKKFRHAVVPSFDGNSPFPKGTKDLLKELGRDKFVEWLKNEKIVQYTDTTYRDAHQSLLATRVRSIDILRSARSYAMNNPGVFSLEVWGGATFDVCLRFLHENPWGRLRAIRERIPNILLQMLLRGSNAVGYKAYPDNLIEKFIEKSAENGIDIFRIFDSLNWVENMKVSIKTVRERTESLAEAAISYSGDILNPENKKYTLEYYLDLARQLEDAGAHILAIKDMAGLLKPYSAEILVKELKKAISLPIHLHTHDTSSVQSAMYLKAIEAGVDVVDVALSSMSGLTSQPNFNSMVSIMEGQERANPLNLDCLNAMANYWETIREYYYPFESGLKAGTAEVYDHEIPGGQYSNLRPQAEALGLGDKFEQIKKNYQIANRMFGNIVKVTPSSKVVGDFALFMTSNDLSEEDIMKNGASLSFPESVVNFFKGNLGQPFGGFPPELQKIILKDEKPIKERANKYLKPVDFEVEFSNFLQKFGSYYDFEDFLSYKLYPKVFQDFDDYITEFGDVSYIPTLAYLYGLNVDEEVFIRLDEGKTLIIKLLYIKEPDEDGNRTVSFELNGQVRAVVVRDRNIQVQKVSNRKINPQSDGEIGAPLQGKLADVMVKPGDQIKENSPLFVIEAMKMETIISAPKAGKIEEIFLTKGSMVEQDDLVLILK